MNKYNLSFLLCTALLFFTFFTIIPKHIYANNTNNTKKTIKKARALAREARNMETKGDLIKSNALFLKVSEIYKKLLINEPDNKTYKGDLEHYLNRSGQVYLRYAKFMSKKKEFKVASKYYNLAIASFEHAKKTLPKSKIFLQNITYCKYYEGIAGFAYILESHNFAPAFSIKKINGGIINLNNFKGGPVILKFWTGWCPESRKDMVLMKKLYNKYHSKGLNVICIAMDRVKTWGKSGSDKRVIELSKTLPFYSGWGTEDIYYKYGVFRYVPTLILLNKELKIVKKIKSENRKIDALSYEIEKLL